MDPMDSIGTTFHPLISRIENELFKPFTINYLTWVTTSQQLLERVAVIFLKDQLVVWIACYFTALMILKTLFENTLYFQNALIEAIMAGK